MNRFPSQESIVNAVFKGIEEARKNFLFWTNDRLYLSHGPEKIITIHVAQAIAKIKSSPEIYIDATVSDILRCSLSDRNGFAKYMKRKGLHEGSFSITLDKRQKHKNDNDSISKAIISIKKVVRNVKNEYSFEIERICKMLDTSAEDNSTLDYGIFAFYSDLSATARKKLDERITLVIQSFDEIVKKFPNLKSNYKSTGVVTEENIGEWLIGMYIIERA
ncbi:MAG: hypothetical protein R3331_11920 [Sulfurospirillaceae bacterium]|nr:hypothetical protein [Sulfurospirillaceae bacterium]